MPDLRIGRGLPVKSKNKFAMLTLFDLDRFSFVAKSGSIKREEIY